MEKSLATTAAQAAIRVKGYCTLTLLSITEVAMLRSLAYPAGASILALFALGCGGSPTEPTPPPPPPPPQPSFSVDKTYVLVPPGEVTATWSCPAGATSAYRSWTQESTSVSGSALSLITTAGNHTWYVGCRGSWGEVRSTSVTISALQRIVLEVRIVPTNLLGPEIIPLTRVYARRGSAVDSVDIGSDLQATIFTRFIHGECLDELVVDEVNVANRKFFPQVVQVEGDICQSDNNVSFIRSPVLLRIPSGRYAGSVVPMDLDGDAYHHVNDPQNTSFLWRWSAGENKWGYRGTWKGSAPYSFHPDRDFDFPEADSLGYVAFLEEMNDEVGIPLVHNVPFSGTDSVIMVRLDANNNTGNNLVGSDGDIYGGNVRNTALGVKRARKPKHEMLHALGLGHTERRTSVMSLGHSTADPWYGMLSVEDVAYIHLLYGARDAQRQSNSKYWLPESHQGERKLMLDMSVQGVYYSPGGIGFVSGFASGFTPSPPNRSPDSLQWSPVIE